MRFSGRDLFWLTLAAAIGLGWWADRREIAQKHDAKVQVLLDEIRHADIAAARRWQPKVDELNKQIFRLMRVHGPPGTFSLTPDQAESTDEPATH